LDKFAAEQAERGDPSLDPHRVLNNRADDPVAEEWPDPADHRPGPRAPYPPEEEPPAPGPRALSKREPHPRSDPEALAARERKREERER
jgi:hypothetical protein